MENTIRPFTIGCKNWHISASVKGAEASAMFYSVIATACANGLSLENYLTRIFYASLGTLLFLWLSHNMNMPRRSRSDRRGCYRNHGIVWRLRINTSRNKK
ncbi:MAG: hypothetical protein IKX20_02780 [Paludibacteraceae bacterium]|nr:hypothetical protein [Paludibacteraceae bacterium]